MHSRATHALVLIAACSLVLLAQPRAACAIRNSMPSVSPDGRRIAFLSDRDRIDNVFTIHVDGSMERQVTRGGAQRPQWSGDGRRLRFAGLGADSGRVFAVSTDSRRARVVATVAGRNPVLSPDGKRAAYLTGPWTSTALVIANADGSMARAIAGGYTTAWNAAWSRDGARIAYTYRDSTRVLQIHVVNAEGLGDRAVTHMTADEGSAQMPAWSPDGRRLAVQVSNGRTHTGHLWIVDLATGGALKLASHVDGILDEVPAWFPDGSRLAFQSNRSGQMQVWTMRADGSDPRQKTGHSP